MSEPHEAALQAARHNRLLATLPQDELERLAPDLDHVDLRLHDTVIRAGKPFPDVYFPLDCVISMTGRTTDERVVEIATVGYEGMAGSFAFLGGRTMPFDGWAQIPGEALRLRVPALQSEVARGGALDAVLRRYIQALFAQVAQGVICNRLHGMEERAAKWLLMTQDRARRETFALTQEFLAYLLGTRRATASLTVSALQRAGYVKHRRGQITITDRAGLEDITCECYNTVRQSYDEMLDDMPSPDT